MSTDSGALEECRVVLQNFYLFMCVIHSLVGAIFGQHASNSAVYLCALSIFLSWLQYLTDILLQIRRKHAFLAISFIGLLHLIARSRLILYFS